ncbi:MAG: HTH domain-containing protein [Clostridia bacterium]|nr:HTH domain-containing protein [Clostridia bacterium]
MKVFEYLDRISRMHRMLTRQHTGTPSEFASHLGVSRTTLYEMIDELKSRGAPISYSKSSCTFFYTEPFEINVSCSLRPLNHYEETQMTGGNFFGRVLFFRTALAEISI